MKQYLTPNPEATNSSELRSSLEKRIIILPELPRETPPWELAHPKRPARARLPTGQGVVDYDQTLGFLLSLIHI